MIQIIKRTRFPFSMEDRLRVMSKPKIPQIKVIMLTIETGKMDGVKVGKIL